MKNILITGGAGYIGSHTAKLFLEKGYKVTIFDNLSTGHKGVIKVLEKYGDVKFVQGDLTNIKDIKRLFTNRNFDAAIHFAAKLLVNESMINPYIYFKNNVYGTLNLLEQCRLNNVSKLVFSSSCVTYGESEYLPLDENHPQNPTSAYGESKIMMEKQIEWYSKLFGLNYVILRYFNVCGADPSGDLGDAKDPSVHLMQNVVRGAMNIEPFYLTCPKVDTPDGTPIRDYTDVVDLADAHYLAYKYLENGKKNDVFNLGNGTGYSVLEIVEKVEEVFGVEINKDSGETRKGEYAAIYADNSKAREILGWKPKISLEQSVLNLKNWYQKHPNGYK